MVRGHIGAGRSLRASSSASPSWRARRRTTVGCCAAGTRSTTIRLRIRSSSTATWTSQTTCRQRRSPRRSTATRTAYFEAVAARSARADRQRLPDRAAAHRGAVPRARPRRAARPGRAARWHRHDRPATAPWRSGRSRWDCWRSSPSASSCCTRSCARTCPRRGARSPSLAAWWGTSLLYYSAVFPFMAHAAGIHPGRVCRLDRLARRQRTAQPALVVAPRVGPGALYLVRQQQIVVALPLLIVLAPLRQRPARSWIGWGAAGIATLLVLIAVQAGPTRSSAASGARRWRGWRRSTGCIPTWRPC